MRPMHATRTGRELILFAAFALAARLLVACISDEKLDPLTTPVPAADAATPNDAGDAAAFGG